MCILTQRPIAKISTLLPVTQVAVCFASATTETSYLMKQMKLAIKQCFIVLHVINYRSARRIYYAAHTQPSKLALNY